MSSASRSPTRTRRRSPRSGRPSTTSPRTSSAAPTGDAGALRRLIEALPPERLEHVLTHTSWAPDRASSYERLEFLGDSVLELAIARELYERFPDSTEGRLAKIRSHVVSRQSCAAVALELGLGEQLGRAAAAASAVADDELARIVKSRNVVAALLEAAIAALFLEHGYESIESAIVAAFSERIDYAATTHVDHKTELQEALAKSGRQVSYAVLEVIGPPHDRRFECAALVDGDELGRGAGRSKKDAEQAAAKEALASLGGAAA
ncbi:MAG TPA: ribonuclease III [Gaiellaceae bacterium]|nr:ribonuclease III [Gaiellaceae bacterium]